MATIALLLSAVVGTCLVHEIGKFLGSCLKQSPTQGENLTLVVAAAFAAVSILFSIALARSGHQYPWGMMIALMQLSALSLLLPCHVVLRAGCPQTVLTILSGVCVAPSAAHIVSLRATMLMPEMPDQTMALWVVASCAVAHLWYVWSIGNWRFFRSA